MAAESCHRKKKMNKGRELTVRIKKTNFCVLPLCNTDVYAPDSLPPGTRYKQVFLQPEPNKI